MGTVCPMCILFCSFPTEISLLRPTHTPIKDRTTTCLSFLLVFLLKCSMSLPTLQMEQPRPCCPLSEMVGLSRGQSLFWPLVSSPGLCPLLAL